MNCHTTPPPPHTTLVELLLEFKRKIVKLNTIVPFDSLFFSIKKKHILTKVNSLSFFNRHKSDLLKNEIYQLKNRRNDIKNPDKFGNLEIPEKNKLRKNKIYFVIYCSFIGTNQKFYFFCSGIK